MYGYGEPLSLCSVGTVSLHSIFFGLVVYDMQKGNYVHEHGGPNGFHLV